MSQNDVNDPEVMEDADRSLNQPVSVANQRSKPSQEEFHFGDSSGPLFSIYSDAAEDEDNKMADRWQKDAEGILIFTGLFSAAVAALLAVTVQSLIPNSQDTAVFYLGNIYGFLADPNATRASSPPLVAKPTPFSPPRYAIWVNSLWFLSLVISLTCALLATSSHQWARRYIRVTQQARCCPETRARMRAFFANGVEKMHIAWVVESLPTLLHLSLFLFFAGLVIFLFNINHTVFSSVAWWIGIFTIIYGLITLAPIVRHDSPFFSPLSLTVWFLYASISHLFFTVRFSMLSNRLVDFRTWQRLRASKDRYRSWILGGVEKAAEVTASERLSEIDAHIFGWTLDVVEDDDRLEKVFAAVPGFFNSNLVKVVKEDLPKRVLNLFWKGSDGFVDRTLLSNSVTGPVKSRRLDIGMNAMSAISIPGTLSIPCDILFQKWDQAPQDVEMGHVLTRWCTNKNEDIAQYARCIATRLIASVPERDDRWIELANRVLGLSERNLRDYIAHGDSSISLSILISVARRDIHSDLYDWGVLSKLSELDIRDTLPGLQRDFCTLWNLCVQEAWNQGLDSYPVGILRLTRLLYLGLHEGTLAAPTNFSVSTGNFEQILLQPSSYPSCNIPSHHPNTTIPNSLSVPLSDQPGDSPNATPHRPLSSGNAAPRLTEEKNIVARAPLQSDQTMISEIRETSQVPAVILPGLPTRTLTCPTEVSASSDVAPVPQDIASAVTLFHPLESAKQQDVAALWVVPYSSQTSPTVPTSSSAPVSAAPALNHPFVIHDSDLAIPSTFPRPASSAVPTSPFTYITSSPNVELLSLLDGKSLSSPPNNATLSRLRAHILPKEGNMCFNAVLQLLVYCPPFWNLFSDLGRLTAQTGQRGQGEDQRSGSVATPLVDATVRLLGEFVYKEKLSLTQQSLQDEKEKEDVDGTDPFLLMYVCDVMKQKKQFKSMLNGQQEDTEQLFCAYLDALDEELSALFASIGSHMPMASAVLGDGSQPGESQLQTEAGKRDHITSPVKTPISCIFEGTFRTTVCMAGKPDTVTIEGRQSLQLDIQPDSVHTVQDALVHVFQPRFAQVGPSGPSTGEAGQQVTLVIEVLPPVLVLHLKRLSYDATTDGIVKKSKRVQLSSELEIPPDIMAPPSAGQPAWLARYTLYGVLYHHGKSSGGGHYSVDVLDLNAHGDNGDAWLHIDDETVSMLRHEDVFGRHDNERVDDRCAYLLLYCRTTSPQT